MECPASNRIPEAIAVLAVRLHQEQGDALLIEDDSVLGLHDDLQFPVLWAVQGHQLEFTSISARNQCVAAHIYREHAESIVVTSEAAAFDVAVTLLSYEYGKDDSAAGRFMALFDGSFDVLGAAAKLIDCGEREVFRVLDVVKVTLSYLPTIDIDQLCALVLAQHPRTEGDLAYGSLFSKIERFLASRPELAWALYRRLVPNVNDATVPLMASALLALAHGKDLDAVVDQVLEDAESGNEFLSQVAMRVVGCILATCELPADAHSKCVRVLLDGSKSAVVEVRRAAMCAIERAAPQCKELADELLLLGKSEDREALAVVVQYMFRNNEALRQDGRLPEFLEVAACVPPDLGNCINHLDFVVSRLWSEADKADLLLKFLEAWLIRHGEGSHDKKDLIELFDSTIAEICKTPSHLHRLITEWLTSEQPQLQWACCSLIGFLWVRGARDLCFSMEVIDKMANHEILHLVRRMLGYVFHEEILLSMTFSLVEARDAPSRTYPFVLELLKQEVGRNYPTATLQKISGRMDSAAEPLRSLLEDARNELTAYQKAIDGLPPLQELQGSAQLRRAIALQKQALMQESTDAAQQSSVLMKLVTKVPVKAGTGWFSIRDGKVGETTEFGAFSHSVTLPVRSVSDPVGYEIDGLFYRLAKRGQE